MVFDYRAVVGGRSAKSAKLQALCQGLVVAQWGLNLPTGVTAIAFSWVSDGISDLLRAQLRAFDDQVSLWDGFLAHRRYESAQAVIVIGEDFRESETNSPWSMICRPSSQRLWLRQQSPR